MTRLYLNEDFQERSEIILNAEQSHYIHHVLRYKEKDVIKIFNERVGEWTAIIKEINKKSVLITVQFLLHSTFISKPLWLAFSPLKHEAMNFLIEKPTELGVTHLQPLITKRCNVQRLNYERLQKNTIEAAQQCGRLDIPTILPLITLNNFLEDLPLSIKWFAAVERQHPTLPFQSFNNLNKDTACGFIIGPEGGFSEKEKHNLANHVSINLISLGKLILRAETAALSALAVINAMVYEN